MEEMTKMEILLTIVVIVIIGLPTLIYFCVKFGTVAFFKGKQFIEKEKGVQLYGKEKEKESKEESKETGLAKSNNY